MLYRLPGSLPLVLLCLIFTCASGCSEQVPIAGAPTFGEITGDAPFPNPFESAGNTSEDPFETPPSPAPQPARAAAGPPARWATRPTSGAAASAT